MLLMKKPRGEREENTQMSCQLDLLMCKSCHQPIFMISGPD